MIITDSEKYSKPYAIAINDIAKFWIFVLVRFALPCLCNNITAKCIKGMFLLFYDFISDKYSMVP